MEDERALSEIVQRFVHFYERSMPRPWVFDSSSIFAERLLGQIVGFRMDIEKVEGKWKLNQNHPVERREKVIRALRQRGDENAQAIAEMMQAMLPAED